MRTGACIYRIAIERVRTYSKVPEREHIEKEVRDHGVMDNSRRKRKEEGEIMTPMCEMAGCATYHLYALTSNNYPQPTHADPLDYGLKAFFSLCLFFSHILMALVFHFILTRHCNFGFFSIKSINNRPVISFNKEQSESSIER